MVTYRDDRKQILADVYGKTKELKWYIDLLAFKVGELFPRLKAEITRIDNDKQIIEINRGERNRFFPGMKLWLYQHSTQRNVSLQQISLGEITNLYWYSCQISPEKST